MCYDNCSSSNPNLDCLCLIHTKSSTHTSRIPVLFSLIVSAYMTHVHYRIKQEAANANIENRRRRARHSDGGLGDLWWQVSTNRLFRGVNRLLMGGWATSGGRWEEEKRRERTSCVYICSVWCSVCCGGAVVVCYSMCCIVWCSVCCSA